MLCVILSLLVAINAGLVNKKIVKSSAFSVEPFPERAIGRALEVVASTTTATTTTALIAGQACEQKNGGYLPNSPGNVDSLAVCLELCEASTQCQSATLYADKLCSHFSTACTNLVTAAGATTVRFQPVSRNIGWALVGSFGKQCNIHNGEKYLKSSPGNGN